LEFPWNLVLVVWSLFVFCLPAVFLAGCLEFAIYILGAVDVGKKGQYFADKPRQPTVAGGAGD